MKKISTFVVFALVTMVFGSVVVAEDSAIVKGQAVFDENRLESWDKHQLEVPFEKIETRLVERVDIPPVPFPKNWGEMELTVRQNWIKEFDASDEGKKFIANRNKLIADGRKFEVKLERDGSFVIFDVPPGVYGLQGRFDKEIGGATFGFEVLGEIEVLKGVDEIELDPIQVAVTPLLQAKQTAPPISINTHDNKLEMTLDTFKDKYLFVCFWITSSPGAGYQADIQKMYVELKGKHPLRLLSICVDEDRKKALDYIVKQKFREGSHGFSDGFDHRTLFDYGVRTFPSFWLIGPDGKIAMSPSDFAKAFRSENDLGVIISNRILGKDTSPSESGTGPGF